jgi:hypothetical protein
VVVARRAYLIPNFLITWGYCNRSNGSVQREKMCSIRTLVKGQSHNTCKTSA